MTDFDQRNPPPTVTNPDPNRRQPTEHREYPRHLHKVGEHLVVNSDEEKAAAVADGWALAPAVAPPAPKGKK